MNRTDDYFESLRITSTTEKYNGVGTETRHAFQTNRFIHGTRITLRDNTEDEPTESEYTVVGVARQETIFLLPITNDPDTEVSARDRVKLHINEIVSKGKEIISVDDIALNYLGVVVYMSELQDLIKVADGELKGKLEELWSRATANIDISKMVAPSSSARKVDANGGRLFDTLE